MRLSCSAVIEHDLGVVFLHRHAGEFAVTQRREETQRMKLR
jgi:hypothetical protein